MGKYIHNNGKVWYVNNFIQEEICDVTKFNTEYNVKLNAIWGASQTQNKGEGKMRKIYHKEMLKKMGIEQVIHNEKATIVILNDGRKGVAVRDKNELEYTPFGFAIAYAYAMGTDGNKSQFKKNLKKIIK